MSFSTCDNLEAGDISQYYLQPWFKSLVKIFKEHGFAKKEEILEMCFFHDFFERELWKKIGNPNIYDPNFRITIEECKRIMDWIRQYIFNGRDYPVMVFLKMVSIL